MFTKRNDFCPDIPSQEVQKAKKREVTQNMDMKTEEINAVEVFNQIPRQEIKRGN